MTISSQATTLQRVFSWCSRKWPQTSSLPDKADDMSVTQRCASTDVRAEGWDVFDCGMRK